MWRFGGNLHFKQFVALGFYLDSQILAVDIFFFDGVIGRLKGHVGKTKFQAFFGVSVGEATLGVGNGNKQRVMHIYAHVFNGFVASVLAVALDDLALLGVNVGCQQ